MEVVAAGQMLTEMLYSESDVSMFKIVRLENVEDCLVPPSYMGVDGKWTRDKSKVKLFNTVEEANYFVQKTMPSDDYDVVGEND
jgi:hypothetical protein